MDTLQRIERKKVQHPVSIKPTTPQLHGFLSTAMPQPRSGSREKYLFGVKFSDLYKFLLSQQMVYFVQLAPITSLDSSAMHLREHLVLQSVAKTQTDAKCTSVKESIA